MTGHRALWLIALEDMLQENSRQARSIYLRRRVIIPDDGLELAVRILFDPFPVLQIYQAAVSHLANSPRINLLVEPKASGLINVMSGQSCYEMFSRRRTYIQEKRWP